MKQSTINHVHRFKEEALSIRLRHALGNETKLIYDSLDRVIETINPLGYSKKFEYDAAGNITGMTDENGNITQYRYDMLGNIAEVIDAAGHSTKYDYDKAGRMTRFEQHRLIDDTLANTQQPEIQVTTYERDRNGKVIAVTSSLGDVVKYGYDGAGNAVSKLDEEGFYNTHKIIKDYPVLTIFESTYFTGHHWIAN